MDPQNPRRAGHWPQCRRPCHLHSRPPTNTTRAWKSASWASRKCATTINLDRLMTSSPQPANSQTTLPGRYTDAANRGGHRAPSCSSPGEDAEKFSRPITTRQRRPAPTTPFLHRHEANWLRLSKHDFAMASDAYQTGGENSRPDDPGWLPRPRPRPLSNDDEGATSRRHQRAGFHPIASCGKHAVRRRQPDRSRGVREGGRRAARGSRYQSA